MANVTATGSFSNIAVTSTTSNITVTDSASNVVVTNVATAVSNVAVTSTATNVIVSATASISNSQVRESLTVNDTGGLGSLTYSNVTGIFTYTGASDSEIAQIITDNPANVRTAISATSPVTYNNSTGVIGLEQNLSNITLTQFQETVVDQGVASGNISGSISAGTIHKYSLVGDVTGITLADIQTGGGALLIFQQDGIGGHDLDITTHASNWTNWEFSNDDSSIAGLRDNKAAGIAISLAKNGITREDAISIYDMCLQGSDTRSHMYYKLLAKQYGVSMGKIRDVANGHHPALEDKDVETDVANWKSKQLGYYVYTSPAGVEHTFKDFYELGAWLWKTEHGITDKTQHQNWCKGRMWFEGKQPNTVYVKQRRFWKGWEYVNIVE